MLPCGNIQRYYLCLVTVGCLSPSLSASIPNIQALATFEGFANSVENTQGFNERTWTANVFSIYR